MSRRDKSVIFITAVVIFMLLFQIAHYVGYAIKYNKKFNYVDYRLNSIENRLDNIEYRVDKVEKKES